MTGFEDRLVVAAARVLLKRRLSFAEPWTDAVSIAREMKGELWEQERPILLDLLVDHQRVESGCSCGWGTLAGSFADHVVSMFEEAVGP